MNRIFSRLGFTAVAIVAGSGIVAHAQTATTGAITGVVRDASGNPLAGATVIAVSTQLTRTTSTDASGAYRLALLNAGEWTIKATKAGQTAPSQKVTVLLNNAISVNLKLATEASAVVTVVAAAASMDPTTTQVGSVLQLESLSAVPIGRDFNGLVLLAPGTTSGGIMGGQSISGASAIENNFVIDGLDTTDYRLGFQGSFMPTDFIDQVEIQTGGFKPEYSALGGVVNAITKSGTNQFVGSAWVTSDMAQLQGRPEQNDYYHQAAPLYRYDFGFTAGGAFIPDKLFYFVGVNQINTETTPNTNLIGLKDSAQTAKFTNVYAKFNWFITQGQQITGTVQTTKDPIDQDHQYPTSIGNRDFGFHSTNNVTNWSLNYDWTISPTLLLSAKYGSSVNAYHLSPTSALPSITDYMWYTMGPGASDPKYGEPAHAALGAYAFRHGGSGDWNDTTDSNSQQGRLDLSWYLGDHSLKFGYSHNSATSFVLDFLAGDDRVTIYPETRTQPRATPAGDLRYINVTTYANLGSKATLTYDAYYAQDQWEIVPGFRLSYGARLENQTVKGNNGQTIFKFTDFKDQLQPRIGITWDINNDGKTKLSANYAVYEERFPMQAALRTGGNETYQSKNYYGPYYATSTSTPYHTATYDKTTGNYTVDHTKPDSVADYSGYFRDDPQPLDGLKVPKRSEYILGADHTFASGWTLGIHAKYRKQDRIIEDTVPTDANGTPIDYDPATKTGGYSILWNPQYGKTYQWRNNKYASLPGNLNTWTNTEFPNPKNNYSSVDLTLDKKTDRWSFSANFTVSHSYGNYEGVGQSSNGQSDANITSTWDYFPYIGNGNLSLDHRYSAKAYGSYTWDLFSGLFSAGGSLTYQSGAPISYFDNGYASGGSQDGSLDIGSYGDAVPEHGQYGSRGRLPQQTVGNLHLDYAYKFSKTVKLTPSIDVFNLFNARTVTGVDQDGTLASTAGYNGGVNPASGYANSWLAGRSYRWGVKVTF